MKTFSYYIMMVVMLTTAIFAGCSDDDVQSLSPYSGVLSFYDFTPHTGKGGTQLLINGEQFPLDVSSIKVSINGVELSVLKSNEEQLLVEVPDNELADNAPVVVAVGDTKVQSKANFMFQKAAVTSFSPSVGKVGTVVKVYIANMPDEVKELVATYKDIAADCTFDEEEGCFLIIIPELDEEGVFPIELSFSGRIFSFDFEYDDAPIYERTVSTLPGNDIFNFKGSLWESTSFRLGSVAVDDNGNVFVGDFANVYIRKIAPNGEVSNFAGTGSDSPDWGINWRTIEGGSYNVDVRASDIKVDSKGNLYSCDNWIASSIFFEPDGKAHYMGYSPSHTIAIDEAHNRFYLRNGNALFMKRLDDYGTNPTTGGEWILDTNNDAGGMDVDKNTGDVYAVLSSSNKIVRYAYTATGLAPAEVIAGTGKAGNADGPRLDATFSSPWGIAVTPEGNLLIAGNGVRADSEGTVGAHIDQSIRYIDMKTGMVTTFAGSSVSGNEDGTFILPAYAGINSSEQVLPASLGAPSAVCVAKDGTVYVLDRLNNCVKKITTIVK